MNLNKVQLIGRIVRDPELKALPSGMKVVGFSMATNRTFKDKSGAKKDTTEFHNLVGFGRQAEVISQYVKKGHLLFVEGRLQTRSWDGKDGKKNYKTEIVLETFQFGPKPAGTSAPREEKTAIEKDVENFDQTVDELKGEEISPDDIPF